MSRQSRSAHHSFAPHFDIKKPVSISGKVVEFEARNPHSYLRIRAVDESGRTEEYVCESHGVTQLSRNGITPALLKPGTEVRVEGSRSRTDAHRCFFTDRVLPGRAGAERERAEGRAAGARVAGGSVATSPAHGCSRRSRAAARATRSR